MAEIRAHPAPAHPLEHERDRLHLLLDVHRALAADLDLRALFRALAASLRRVTGCEFVGLAVPDPRRGDLRQALVDYPHGNGVVVEGLRVPMNGSASGKAFRRRELVCLGDPEEARRDPDIFGSDEGRAFYGLVLAEGQPAGYFLPLIHEGEVIAVLQLKKYAGDGLLPQERDFLSALAAQITLAVANAFAHERLKAAHEQLRREHADLRQEAPGGGPFEEIAGRSPALLGALREAQTVARTDSTALLLGETGTGKELVARAIHRLSARAGQPFVKLNCAAIPSGLLESELFGHERGAFTGAIARKIGRFEAADTGTLFLDEIGDLPLELQPKLLRVLQDHEFERLGSTRTQRVDIRLVAATHRNLRRMVAEGTFREDLYYRLNVFPIHLPPLRDRPGDIPLLARHFVDHYARRMGKRIGVVPAEAVRALAAYGWPGNVRELQNVIERAVILTSGSTLALPALDVPPEDAPAPGDAAPRTLRQAEREHVLDALRRSNWVIGGGGGAAARLGVPRTTLLYRMEKLGITRPPP
jgi:formate hydrogenlyase transcriptional activator